MVWIWLVFVKYLINIKKIQKKCKIWSESTFYLDNHAERFGSTIWILKMKKIIVVTQICCNLIPPLYIYMRLANIKLAIPEVQRNQVVFNFRSQKRRSKPLDVFSILKCAWRPNFIFFIIFLLFIKPLWKLLIQR